MYTNPSEINYQPFLETLNKLGFCTCRVFNSEEIERLQTLYNQNFGSDKVKEMYATHNSNPMEKSLFVSNEIKNIVKEKLQKIFPEYNYFIGHFMVKGANTEKEFSLHQDWNIVDENKYKSYQVWIPLQLTYPDNGGMFVVPGSHLFFNNYRSGSYGIPVIPFDENVKPLITDIIVPPGNVLVYHNALFHGSYPNTSDEIRIAVIVNVVEKQAPVFYFHKNKQLNSTQLFSIDGQSLISHLQELEKGIVDETFILKNIIDNDKINNDKLNSNDLRLKYEENIGNVNASQLKQLHITNNSDLEEKLNDKGYAIIDLMDAETIEKFKNEYYAYFNNLDRTPGRFTTLQHTDAELKNRIHTFIINNISKPLNNFFKDYYIPVSQFYTKKAHTSGDIDLHADSTLLINHQLEPHYAIWVPLIDVNSNNGTLTLIPHSHKVKGAFFGGTFGGYHHQHLQWLKQFEVPLTLKAGQAVIFDNNILHNSTSNLTDIDRLCITFRITHKSSMFYSFFRSKLPENSIDVYQENHNYYMDEYWDGENKNSNSLYIGTMKYNFEKITKEKLQKIIA